MGQVSREINPNPPSGGPKYNMDDYIRQRDPYEVGDETSEKREKKATSL